MGWVVTAVGGLVVVVGLRDVFQTLWHPTGTGWLSGHVMSAVWRLARSQQQRGRPGVLAGPVAMVLSIVAWVVVLVVGFTLVYAPHMPEGFLLGSSLDPSRRGGWLDALYASTVTLATLGYGDIVPSASWLRVVVPGQALLGFATLTAAATWVMQIYPALVRRRVLALRLAGLHRVGPARFVGDPHGQFAAQVLESLAAGVVQARVDLTQYSSTYYFRDGTEETSLAAMLGTAQELSEAARDAPREDVRVAGELLGLAVHDLAGILDQQYLHRDAGVTEVLEAYADDHGHRVVRAG
ncbi:potassium channel family protein [Modestobacter roseus]|uniref:potassium channel family protein n=1 Tax=Modestobacter roseus TaxID=1181884 RepID=UPI0034E04922